MFNFTYILQVRNHYHSEFSGIQTNPCSVQHQCCLQKFCYPVVFQKLHIFSVVHCIWSTMHHKKVFTTSLFGMKIHTRDPLCNMKSGTIFMHLVSPFPPLVEKCPDQNIVFSSAVSAIFKKVFGLQLWMVKAHIRWLKL